MIVHWHGYAGLFALYVGLAATTVFELRLRRSGRPRDRRRAAVGMALGGLGMFLGVGLYLHDRYALGPLGVIAYLLVAASCWLLTLLLIYVDYSTRASAHARQQERPDSHR